MTLQGAAGKVAPSGLLMAWAFMPCPLWAEPSVEPPVRFNTAFIRGQKRSVDIEGFLRGNPIMPGTYRVDVFVNQVLLDRRDLVFSAHGSDGQVGPCLTRELLEALGLDMQRLAEQLADRGSPACLDLPRLIEQAQVEYLPNAQHLQIEVPQLFLVRRDKTYVDPRLWDSGLGAAFINYTFNLNHRESARQRGDSGYLGTRSGVNLGVWRLRNESSFSQSEQGRRQWRNNRSYLERDVDTLRSQLTVGQIYSGSMVFDSVRFSGLHIGSDEAMLPPSQSGYAPVIRGVADSRATVEVRQKGYLLHSSNVAAGPFEISDVYPSGSNGDLDITIIEADGRRRSYQQSFASLPILVRKGASRYSVSLGQYEGYRGQHERPSLLSADAAYGLTDDFTVSGGMQWAGSYRAGNLGGGFNTRLGGLSADLTHSSSLEHGERLAGQSLRLLYKKSWAGSGTGFTLGAYRYSSEGYRSLDDGLAAGTGVFSPRGSIRRLRSRLDIRVEQPLGERLGFVYVNRDEQQFWNTAARSVNLQLGYSVSWAGISYNVALARSSDSGPGRFGARHRGDDTRLSFGVNVPLGAAVHAPRLYLSARHDAYSGSVGSARVAGYLNDQGSLSYTLEGSQASCCDRSGEATLAADTEVGRFGMGYYREREASRSWLEGSGSLVAHAGGLNAGQAVGETFALLQVPSVSGARLASAGQVATAANGFAVIPSLQPYRRNWVALDTRQLGADVEIENALQQLIPRRGAVALAHFPSTRGRRVQLLLERDADEAVPFGASVEDETGVQLAIVDGSSRALVLSQHDQGRLIVRWPGQQCVVEFTLAPRDPARSYERQTVRCQ